jgi:hypothetical protein
MSHRAPPGSSPRTGCGVSGRIPVSVTRSRMTASPPTRATGWLPIRRRRSGGTSRPAHARLTGRCYTRSSAATRRSWCSARGMTGARCGSPATMFAGLRSIIHSRRPTSVNGSTAWGSMRPRCGSSPQTSSRLTSPSRCLMPASRRMRRRSRSARGWSRTSPRIPSSGCWRRSGR